MRVLNVNRTLVTLAMMVAMGGCASPLDIADEGSASEKSVQGIVGFPACEKRGFADAQSLRAAAFL